jgi:hypothetical protein
MGSRAGSVLSNVSYALDFTLADGGSLTLVSHSLNDLSGGWQLRFERHGSGSGSLRVTLRAEGASADASPTFAGFDASGPLKFQVDVHNQENPARALLWSRALSDDFSPALVVFDTDSARNSPGQGTGPHWGLRLKNATVTRADLSGPKLNDTL